MAENQEPRRYEKETLLSKYQIPIQNLDYDYIEKCQNGSELEKILSILQSGEEGIFPDLIKTAEKQLFLVKPTSMLLRHVSPVIKKNEIDQTEQDILSEDLENWINEVRKKDYELEERKIKSDTEIPISQNVRVGKNIDNIQIKPIAKKIASTDYESWDKYDADTEILKMDLEDEKLKKEALQTQKGKQQKTKVVRFNDHATEAEAIIEANCEKEKGNECFKAKEYHSALQHYTNSLGCKPLAAVYTNRALVYNILKKYQKAIDDCMAALKIEPRNFKAHLRLAQNYEMLSQYDEALKHIDIAIEIDPNNTATQELAHRIQKTCGKVSVDKRFTVKDVDTNNSNKVTIKPILKCKNDSETRSNKHLNVNSKTCYNKQVENKDESRLHIANKYTNKVSIHNSNKCNDKLNTKTKNVTPKGYNYEVVSIPGTSTMPPPYYKIIESNDPEFIKAEKRKLLCRPTLLHITTIDVTSNDDEDYISQSNLLAHQATATLKIKDDTRTSPQKSKKAAKVKVTDTKCKNQFKNDQVIQEKQEIVKIMEVETDEKGGGGEPCNNSEDQLQLIPTTEELQSPYTFMQVWNSIKKDSTYTQQAHLLRKLDHARLPYIIGYNLDDSILHSIITCLHQHFMVPKELNNLHSILLNITHIPRFKTLLMFLNEADWRYIKELIEFLDQHGHNLPDNIRSVYHYEY